MRRPPNSATGEKEAAMETLSYRHKAQERAAGSKSLAITGVVASGNLEVLVERLLPDTECQVDINTAAEGFRAVWEAVVADFVEVHGAKLTGLLRAARDTKSVPVLILFDTGGVRLQEANAGELAIAEIMRALIEARMAGVKIVGLIGGRAGCYGGGGLIAGCCSALAVSEQGRIGVSGPRAIGTNRGGEEFDSRDAGLVWCTRGGKHRRLLGGAEAFVDDAIQSFRNITLHLIGSVPGFALDVLKAEQARLAERVQTFRDFSDGMG